MSKFIVAIFLVLILVGCNSKQGSINSESKGGRIELKYTIGNPTAEDVLSTDPNANIFMYENTIYTEGIDWVSELELTKDKLITEIIDQRVDGKAFSNGKASKLIIGTKIFSVKERNDIVIAETKDGDIRFYMLVEG